MSGDSQRMGSGESAEFLARVKEAMAIFEELPCSDAVYATYL
jgi:hypothetical protein